VIEVKREQLLNAFPIEVIEEGKEIDVKLEQPKNASSSREVTEEGMVMEVKLEQKFNAFPIDVMDEGKEIEVKLEHS